jgi:hypothetical protein
MLDDLRGPGDGGSWRSNLPFSSTEPAAVQAFDKPSIPVRVAVAVGRTWGQWRHRWVAAAQDTYIDAWKAAWTEGCRAAWKGEPSTSAPYRSAPRREAWDAGWNWAQTHPDRRDPGRNVATGARRRVADLRPHLVRAAQGGAVGLTLVAVVRWLSSSRRRSAQESQPPARR